MKKISQRRLAQIKQQVPEYIRKHQLKTDAGVAKAFGICRTFLFNLRKSDPEFEKEFQAAKDEASKDSTERIERQWIKRLLKGKVSASEIIFYLTNKMPDEYRDRRNLIGNISVGAQASASLSMYEDIPDNELITATKAIISRIDKAQQ